MITWDVFESSHRPDTVVVLLTWRSQRAAWDFEREHELPAGVRAGPARPSGAAWSSARPESVRRRGRRAR